MSAYLRCLLLALLVPPVAGAAARPTVTLGLVVSPSEQASTSILRGVQLAVADANASSDGPVVLEVRNAEGQWGTAGNEAVSLVSEAHADGIISPEDGVTSHLVLQVSGRTQIPVASLCPDSSVTEAGVIWAVRVVPRTNQEAVALFAAARRPDRPASRWWAVAPPGRQGRSVRRDLERAARDAGTNLVQILDLGESKASLDAQVHLLVDAAPDGVLAWLPAAQAGTLAAALRKGGFTGTLAGPCPLDSPEFFAAAGAAAEGMRITNFRSDASFLATTEGFGSRYLRRYGASPDYSAKAAHDAAVVLISTLRRSGSGAAERLFPLTIPIQGANGVLHFDNLGNRTDALEVMTCKEGRFVPLSADKTTL